MRTLTFALMALIPAFVNAHVTEEMLPEDGVEVVCQSHSVNDMDPQFVLYYNYGDAPVALEFNYFSNQMIETVGVLFDTTKVKYGHNISVDSESPVKHYTYSIALPIEVLKNMPKELMLVNKKISSNDVVMYIDNSYEIPADFKQCILDNLKKHAN